MISVWFALAAVLAAFGAGYLVGQVVTLGKAGRWYRTPDGRRFLEHLGGKDDDGQG